MKAVRGFLCRLARGDAAAGSSGDEVQAIVEHLRYLLNVRRGDAVTAPDYGIEDLSDLTNSFPEAAELWKTSIRAAIEKYEPRLCAVRVRPRPTEDPLVIGFEISARLSRDDGPLTFQTEVGPTGRFKVW